MKKFVLAVLLFPCFTFAAKTLVITDIDDTLKVTHVRSALHWLPESLETDSYFPGMPLLLQSLAEKEETEIIYVSNAPERLMRARHQAFLTRHRFPPGRLYLWPAVFQKGDKLPTLRKILQTTSATTVILIGDNGEKDPEVYDQITQEFPDLQFSTFIRWDYARPKATELKQNQIPFVTAAEVALFLQPDLLSVEKTIANVLAVDSTDPTLGLPRWVRCTGHRPLLPLISEITTEILALEKRIASRCQMKKGPWKN